MCIGFISTCRAGRPFGKRGGGAGTPTTTSGSWARISSPGSCIEKSASDLNVHWVYFDLPRWAAFWKKGRRGGHAYYYLWQLGAYFVARKLHREVGFRSECALGLFRPAALGGLLEKGEEGRARLLLPLAVGRVFRRQEVASRSGLRPGPPCD